MFASGKVLSGELRKQKLKHEKFRHLKELLVENVRHSTNFLHFRFGRRLSVDEVHRQTDGQLATELFPLETYNVSFANCKEWRLGKSVLRVCQTDKNNILVSRYWKISVFLLLQYIT